MFSENSRDPLGLSGHPGVQTTEPSEVKGRLKQLTEQESHLAWPHCNLRGKGIAATNLSLQILPFCHSADKHIEDFERWRKLWWIAAVNSMKEKWRCSNTDREGEKGCHLAVPLRCRGYQTLSLVWRQHQHIWWSISRCPTAEKIEVDNQIMLFWDDILEDWKLRLASAATDCQQINWSWETCAYVCLGDSFLLRQRLCFCQP